VPLRHDAIPTKGRKSAVADEPQPFEIEPRINVEKIEFRGRVKLDRTRSDLLHNRRERGIIIRGGRVHYT